MTHRAPRRHLLGLATGLGAGLGTLALPTRSRAQSGFPSRPITLIVPFPPGGTTDTVLRALANAAARHLPQPVLVQNCPGAAGATAAESVAHADADGYTVLAMPASAIRAQYLRPTGYDALRDFTYILQLDGYNFGCVVRAADARFPDWAAFLAEARRSPGQLRYAHYGTNGISQITMELLARQERIELLPVDCGGDAQSIQALLANQVEAAVGATGIGRSVDTGEARWLHIWSAERSLRWPDAPTLLELGYRRIVTSPFGLAGPANLPFDAVQILHDAFSRALYDAEHLIALASCDMTVEYLDPIAYALAVREEAGREQALVRELGLRAG